jgi:hypothetical protein
MRTLALQFAMTALITSAACGQELQERTFRFTHIRAPHEIHEVATALRAITGVGQLSSDTEQPSIKLRGSAVQVALAEWVFNELDSTSNRSPSREYRVPGEADDIVRVYYLAAQKSVQEQQEIATLIRSITEIPHLFTFSASRAVIVRATDEKVKLADWLVTELDRTPSPGPGKREYRIPGRADGVVRIFYLTQANSVQELQEAATMIRALIEIRRMFTYNAPKAMVVRGTEDQIKAADWILPDLGRPSTAGAPRTFQMAGETEGIIRVFHLKPEVTVRDLQEVATLVRSMSEIRRLFTFNASRAIAVRGTAGQIDLAQWLVNELDNPGQSTPREFRVAGDDLVRVFYVTNAASTERLHHVATEVRSETKVRRLFTYSTPKAVAVRGTTEQIAMADQMIKDRNK